MFSAFVRLTVRIITVTPVRHLSVRAVRMRFVIAGISRRFSAMIRRKARHCLDTVTRVFEKVIRLRNTSKSICPSASWWIACSRRKDKKKERSAQRANINTNITTKSRNHCPPAFDVDRFFLLVYACGSYVPEKVRRYIRNLVLWTIRV